VLVGSGGGLLFRRVSGEGGGASASAIRPAVKRTRCSAEFSGIYLEPVQFTADGENVPEDLVERGVGCIVLEQRR